MADITIDFINNFLLASTKTDNISALLPTDGNYNKSTKNLNKRNIALKIATLKQVSTSTILAVYY